MLQGAFSALSSIGLGFSVVGFLKGSVEKAMELESISRKLTNTLGPQGAAGALDFARGTADTLGLSFKDLANNFGSFTAAATAAGVPLKQQKELFGAVAKAGQALGLSNDEISGSLLALQQVASKGTVSMEELRGQLGERLPIALAATAKGLGMSQQELIKLVESGRLTSTEFFPALTKGLNDLTEGAGGIPTAAQNFARLQNAWDDLQASFGTSLLPTVTEGVKALAGALDGFKAEMEANDLVRSFGLAGNEALQFSEHLKVIQERYGLTNEQAKNLLSNAIENSGASKNWFGQLNTGGETFSKIQLGLIDQAMKWSATHKDQKTQLNEIAAAEAQRLTQAKEQNAQKLKELASETQLAQAVKQTQKADLDGRTQVQQASINLGKALIDLEDSRFNISKNRNNYELQAAQNRGASEEELNAIKRKGEAIELAALNAKYAGLLKQQGLQKELFALQQQQARLDADMKGLEARQKLEEALIKLNEAKLSGNQDLIRQAERQRDIAKSGVDLSDRRLVILDKVQALEKKSAQATDEIARNGFKAEAASKGLALAADGTFKAAKATAGAFQSYGNSLKVPLNQQGMFAKLAKDMGLDVKDTGKGYYEIGQVLKGSNVPLADKIRNYMKNAAEGTGAAKKQAAGLSSNMDRAADAASDFYFSLRAASGLPPARFAGGPVDAGQTYRINDGPSGMSLGQESFLSASGVLSLINRPLNSTWTAPSRGTVIPAGVTSRLKEAGALGGGAGVLRGGSDPAVAHLSVAVGNLSQEVAELRRKAWNVSVGVRGDGSGLRLAQTMARMR